MMYSVWLNYLLQRIARLSTTRPTMISLIFLGKYLMKRFR